MFGVLVLISLLSRSVASPTLISNLKQISSRTLHQGGTTWCLNSVPGPYKILFVFIRLSAQSIVVWLRKSRIKKYALPIFLKVHRTLFWSRMTQDDIPGVRGAPGGAGPGVDGWRQRYLVKKVGNLGLGNFWITGLPQTKQCKNLWVLDFSIHPDMSMGYGKMPKLKVI